MGFFSRIRCQPDAVKDSLRILSPFIRPHHMRVPQRFGRELFGNLGSFFQICKQELDKAIGIGKECVFDPVLGKVPLIHLHKLRRQGNVPILFGLFST